MSFVMQSPPGPRTLINERWRDYFAGTGYLGLQSHAQVLQAAVDAVQQQGFSTATSRDGFGEHPLYQAVEAAAARFCGAEQAVYLTSGYLSTAALLHSLAPAYDHIFVDDAAHFSVRQAAAMLAKPVTGFHHLDPAALEEACRTRLRAGARPLLLSDGLFPVSGEIAPVPEYELVLASFPGALLCLDDAHALGVLGSQGRGTLEYFGATGPGRYAGGTLSKALGGFGGLVAGDAALIESLRRAGGIFAGASPPPLPAAAASLAALAIASREPERRAQLWANVAQARAGLRALGWPLADSPAPILCLGARPGLDLARIQQELFARDLCVAHVTGYTSTPPGGALRIAIFATHTTAQIERLIAEIGALL